MLARQFEKLLALMSSSAFVAVRTAYVQRARAESRRIESLREYMVGRGYEVVPIAPMTADGRHVFMALGHAWALKPEIHAKRLAEAMKLARKRDAAIAEQQSQPTPPSQQPTTCASLIDGQLCGGTLISAAVCPRCALGKSGVTATLTCDVCGHVTAVMRGDS
jgi:hypothetical protein